MTSNPRNSLSPVMFGTVVALAFVLVVSIMSLQNVAAQCSSLLHETDLDMAEAAEAGNASMAGAANQTTTDGNITGLEFLSIQRAQSGSISEINATSYTLSLKNVSNDTILFSDRPERIVETVSTADFIGSWSTGPDSFASDAPNDALIVEDRESGELDTAVIESFSPVYDIATNSLTYTITAENATSINLPVEFGQTVLVIDGHCAGGGPGC